MGHIDRAPTVLSCDTMLLFYGHGTHGDHLLIIGEGMGVGCSLLKVAPLDLNGGQKPAHSIWEEAGRRTCWVW